MNSKLQTLFGTISSETIGFDSLAEWLEARVKNCQQLLVDITQQIVSDVYTPVSDAAANIVIESKVIIDNVYQCGYLTRDEILLACKNGVSYVTLHSYVAGQVLQVALDDVTSQITSQVVQIQTAIEALRALAATKKDDALSALAVFRDRMSTKFSSMTSDMSNIGSMIINALSSKSASAMNKISIVLQALGLRDNPSSDIIGAPDISGVNDLAWTHAWAVFGYKAGQWLANTWGAVVSALQWAFSKVSSVVSSVLNTTTGGIEKWVETITGVNDSYTIASGGKLTEGPCFGDFGMTLAIPLDSNIETREIATDLNSLCKLTSITWTTSDVQSCVEQLADFMQVTSSMTTIRDTLYDIIIGADAQRYDWYQSGHLTSDEMSAVANICEALRGAAHAGETITISRLVHNVWQILQMYFYDTSTATSAFIQSLSTTSYKRFETIGAFISVWRVGNYAYMLFNWRPIDYKRAEAAGYPVDFSAPTYAGALSTRLTQLTNLAAYLSTNGYFEAEDSSDPPKIFDEGTMAQFINYAMELTAIDLSCRLSCNYDEDSEAQFSAARAFFNEFSTFILPEISATLVYNGLLYSKLLAGYQWDRMDDEQGAAYSAVFAFEGDNYITWVLSQNLSTYLTSVFSFMSNNDYYCAYVTTTDLPVGYLSCMTSNYVMVMCGITLGLVGVIAIVAIMIYLSIKVNRAVFAMEAKVGTLSWDAFSMDEETGKIVTNTTMLKTSLRENRKLKLLYKIQSLLGTSTSEVVTSTSEAITTALNDAVATLNAQVTGTEESDVTPVDSTTTLSYLRKLISGI